MLSLVIWAALHNLYPSSPQLEDIEVSVADHVQKVMKPNFAASWDEVGPDNEMEDTFALSTMKTLEGMSTQYHCCKIWILLLHSIITWWLCFVV